MTRVETYLNENLRKRLDQVEQVWRGYINFIKLLTSILVQINIIEIQFEQFTFCNSIIW